MKKHLEFLLIFLKIGASAFGGGYVIIPLVERELVKKRKWITMEEVIDFYTVSQIMPGMIGVNLSIFIGNKLIGPFAGFLAALGFVLPGASIILVVALLISNFADLPVVQNAFTGIRIAVAALILDTVINLIKGVFKNIKGLILYFFVFILSIFPAGILPAFTRSPVFLVLASGLAGLIIFRQKKIANNGDEKSGGQS